MDVITPVNTGKMVKGIDKLNSEIAGLRKEVASSAKLKWHQWVILVASIVAALASLVSAVK